MCQSATERHVGVRGLDARLASQTPAKFFISSYLEDLRSEQAVAAKALEHVFDGDNGRSCQPSLASDLF